MNWKEITVSPDWTCFYYRGEILFNRTFKSVLKFKGSGLAPVQDDAGWRIIDPQGETVIFGPFRSAWGFYEGLCAVEDHTGCYHIGEIGQPAYPARYAWCGNFQEGACPVRDSDGRYCHIRPDGSRMYAQHYRYCGDFKDGFACVMLPSGRFKHINAEGKYCYEADFQDLGVYHKGVATARDAQGWFHIDLAGKALYSERYAMLEPLYNGVAFCSGNSGEKRICTGQGHSREI